MVDFNPLVLRRILALRKFQMLGTAELRELAMLAENMTEATFPAGAVVAAAGARLRSIHFIVDGEIATSRGERLGARRVFGVLDVFARRELAAPAIAVRETRTLELLSADVKEILDENFGVLRATLRELAAHTIGRWAMPPTRFIAPPARLGFVDRLILLRRQPMLASAAVDAVAMLAHTSEEVSFRPGAIVAHAGERAVTTYAILEGDLRAVGMTARRGAGSGDSIATLETPRRRCTRPRSRCVHRSARAERGFHPRRDRRSYRPRPRDDRGARARLTDASVSITSAIVAANNPASSQTPSRNIPNNA
jgi:CRP-like cAMP-binding protein